MERHKDRDRRYALAPRTRGSSGDGGQDSAGHLMRVKVQIRPSKQASAHQERGAAVG
jgi:hypothetical protein